MRLCCNSKVSVQNSYSNDIQKPVGDVKNHSTVPQMMVAISMLTTPGRHVLLSMCLWQPCTHIWVWAKHFCACEFGSNTCKHLWTLETGLWIMNHWRSVLHVVWAGLHTYRWGQGCRRRDEGLKVGDDEQEIQSASNGRKNKSQSMREEQQNNNWTQHPKDHSNQILIVWSTLPIALMNLGAEYTVVVVVVTKPAIPMHYGKLTMSLDYLHASAYR